METLVSAALGLPVDPEGIDRAFASLWEEAGDSKTRASLLNLVIYCEEPAALEANTAILREIAGRHPCRAILILAQRDTQPAAAKAWINAHCEMVGGRQICSEQITFRLDGDAADSLTSIVFSHLDSDLPLCFWWQATLREPVQEGLWSWVDRLVYDSAAWEDPAGQLALVARIGALGGGRTAIGDLNWARVLGTRFAIAGLFDRAVALAHLATLDHIEIVHGPGYRTTALLLLGWFAARAGWEPLGNTPGFRRPDGGHVACTIAQQAAPPIAACTFRSGQAVFRLDRVNDAFVAGVAGVPCDTAPRAFAVPREGLTDLLISELSRGGRHGNYQDAIRIASRWFV